MPFQTINDEITAFNHMYNGYVTCSTNETLCTQYNHLNGGNDMTQSAFAGIVDAAYSSLITNMQGISSGINGATVFDGAGEVEYDSGGAIIVNGVRSSQYDTNYTKILTDNIKNVKHRNDLESQIKELKNAGGSIYAENKQINDFTIYTNIILTTMITCGIFIVFSKL